MFPFPCATSIAKDLSAAYFAAWATKSAFYAIVRLNLAIPSYLFAFSKSNMVLFKSRFIDFNWLFASFNELSFDFRLFSAESLSCMLNYRNIWPLFAWSLAKDNYDFALSRSILAFSWLFTAKV